MDVSAIDYYANHGTSFLHKARAVSKIFFAGLVISSVVITSNFYLLLAIYLSLLSLLIWTMLPFLKIVTIAAYPALFALIFAAASWNGSWVSASVIVLKAMDAALGMVILIATTPYPDVFSTIRPVLPRIITEGLLLTYRSLFILLELTDNLVRGLRVRGGLTRGRYIKNVVNFSSGIGLLLVRGLDLSEKFYGVLNVRGYSGKISGGQRGETSGPNDFAALLIGVLIFSAALWIRTDKEAAGYGIYVLTLSLISLLISSAYILLPKTGVAVWKR
jgi:cobalt/nickel transport system permease protein